MQSDPFNILSVVNKRKVKKLTLSRMAKWLKEEGDDYFLGYTRVAPIMGKDGDYYDRTSKLCWAEFEGSAFLMNAGDFLYTLALADHRPLRDCECEALTRLEKYKLMPKSLKEKFQKDKEWKYLINLRRGIKKSLFNGSIHEELQHEPV